MPLYNFKAQFADLVANFKKNQTIRPVRKRPTVAGDTLYLYTGLRGKGGARLLRETECTKVTPIAILSTPAMVSVCLDNRFLSIEEITNLARADGFADATAFFQFFAKTYGDLFEGELIEWFPF